MHLAAPHDRASLLLFVGIVVGIYAAALGVIGQFPRLQQHESVVSVALTLDLVVVVPLAFYLLVVLRRGLPIVMLAPVLVLSALAASRVLPADQQQTLRVLEALAAPVELALIGWIGWRAARALREARRDAAADPLEQLRRAAFEVTRNGRAASVLASEIAVFWYAIGSWRARAHAPAGTVAFTHHRRSGHAGIVLAFVLVMTVEGLAVHLLLLGWSTLAAWIFTIGTAYGALWLIADYRATVLRPILVSDEDVLVRAGLRCTIQVPMAQITGIGHEKPSLGKESVNLTLLGTPTHWLTLAEPMFAEGPYGFRRRVRAIGMKPDAAEDFDRILDDRSVERAGSRRGGRAAEFRRPG